VHARDSGGGIRGEAAEGQAGGGGQLAEFECILLEPAAKKPAGLSQEAEGAEGKVPLIAYPHGGPHSNMGQVLSLLALLVEKYNY
jgi:hypothetical protein